MTDTNARTLTIKDVGPIREVTVELPDSGVVVFQGRNGAGKTKALEAVNALLAGEGGLEVRDGVAGSGYVEGLGAEGADPSVLVDPGIDDPERADARRIAELCRLARVAATLDPFADLVGGADELRGIASPKSLALTGLPEIAASLKRDMQAKARDVEGEAQNWRGQGQALLGASHGVDHDAVLEQAIRAKSALETRAAEASKQIAAAARAREALDDARASYDGPTVEAAKADADVARIRVVEIEAELQVARTALQAAQGRVLRAEDYERNTSAWAKSIDAAGSVEPVHDEDLAAAGVAVTRAREAKDAAVLRAKAREQRKKAEDALAKADALAARAERLRTAAGACESVVTDAIAKVAPRGLRVSEGRLVLDTARGETFFAALSHGERWRMALDIAIDAAGEGAVLTLSQEAYEGLDPANRAAIKEHVATRRVVILTAACDDGELRAEVA